MEAILDNWWDTDEGYGEEPDMKPLAEAYKHVEHMERDSPTFRAFSESLREKARQKLGRERYDREHRLWLSLLNVKTGNC